MAYGDIQRGSDSSDGSRGCEGRMVAVAPGRKGGKQVDGYVCRGAEGKIGGGGEGKDARGRGQPGEGVEESARGHTYAG